MKIHKEMVWHKGENAKKDGKYLLATFSAGGAMTHISSIGYTTEWGWNTDAYDHEYSLGQNPGKGTHAWAELPF